MQQRKPLRKKKKNFFIRDFEYLFTIIEIN